MTSSGVPECALAEARGRQPHDTSFRDHRAAFDDRWGTQWWVATRRSSA